MDAHVRAYHFQLPMIRQWEAHDKVWEAYEKRKMTLDQAIEASHRTHLKMAADYQKLGYELR
jgi:predicted ATPase